MIIQRAKTTFGKLTLKFTSGKQNWPLQSHACRAGEKKKKKDAGWNILASHKCHRTYRNVIAAILNAVTEASGSRDRKKSLNFTVHLGNAKPHPISIADHSTEKDQANDKFQSVN